MLLSLIYYLDSCQAMLRRIKLNVKCTEFSSSIMDHVNLLKSPSIHIISENQKPSKDGTPQDTMYILLSHRVQCFSFTDLI